MSAQAGLFSAAMTAFLVESYGNLTQDPNDVMIFLMQRLVAQTSSYSLSAGLLNSTTTNDALTPADSLPNFVASSNAIAVNVLWFASLTLTLITASFGILVKQWLREYFAGEYTSAQARLRVRHFRNPGLRHWKVFEIAAVLPLLLQLALGLFLVGLCLFTAEVHSSIGHTTIPLVAAWGFFFVAAVLAPALSPRCPYKTSFLQSATWVIRRIILRVLKWAARNYTPLDKLPTPSPGKWSYTDLAYDEEKAAGTDSNDIDILVTVDSIQSDDQLLKVMWDALQQIQLSPSESVRFVKEILRHHMRHDFQTPSSVPAARFSSTTTALTGYLDVRSVPKQTTTAVMNMLAEVLANEFRKQPRVGTSANNVWQPWMHDCVYILLSETGGPATDEMNRTFALLLEHPVRLKGLFSSLHQCVSDPGATTFLHVFDKLQGGIMLLRGSDEYTLETLFQHYFCASHVDVHHRLTDILRGGSSHPEVTAKHLRESANFLMQMLMDKLAAPETPLLLFLSRFGLLLTLFDLSDKSWRPTLMELLHTFFAHRMATALFHALAVGLHYNAKNDTGLSPDIHSRVLQTKSLAQELFIATIVESGGAGT